MRVSWKSFSPSILAATIVACGGESYRLGGNNEFEPVGGGAAGAAGQSGGGPGGTSAGSAGRGALADRLEPPGGPPLTSDFEWIVTSELGVTFLATDEQNLYFNEFRGPIWKTDHAGTRMEKLAETESFHMNADATHLYWTTETDMRRVAKTGGETQILAVTSGATMPFGWPALDDANAYCTMESAGTVVRVPKTGEPYQVIANSSMRLGGSAVARGSLFWSEYDSAGAIHRLDLATQVSEPFFQAGPVVLRLAGDSIWFGLDQNFQSWQKTLARVPLGGQPPIAYSVPGHLIPFESDGVHMYWAFTDVVRIDLTTGAQQLVADEVAPANKAGHLAFTQDWIFISTRASPGGILRLPKPPP